MRVDLAWNQFMLRSIESEQANTARRGEAWRHVVGNLYVSTRGEKHVCDQLCVRWVFRNDGLKICAITGLCKNSSNITPPGKLKRRGSDQAGAAAEAMTENNPFHRNCPQPVKRRAQGFDFGPEAGYITDKDMDEDMGNSPNSTESGQSWNFHQQQQQQQQQQQLPQHNSFQQQQMQMQTQQAQQQAFGFSQHQSGERCQCSGLNQSGFCGMHC
mmetsp:Transcript_17868/g.32982  ORF Transcript_17868/g.32982 Transcript_17868/m.32982 type:complete len:214 (-) Transcript_17868:295-936(-)